MDVIYDNLDNIEEVNTIAELQSENKDLKLKLEEYSSALEKLQQDFDKLSSEYKKLELNYSSLLKTAKAEIERKTQIITNLNIEKDKMVLRSYQNKNVTAFKKSDKLKQKSNHKGNNEHKTERNRKIIETDSIKNTPIHNGKERKEEHHAPYQYTTASPNGDLTSRLMNLANSDMEHVDSRIIKKSNAKDKIIESKKENDTCKTKALIRNRRKSMSAVSLEMEKFNNDDDDVASAGSSKDISKEITQRNVSQNISNKQNTHVSDISSLEDKTSAYNEHPYDSYKSRHSKYYDSDRYRKRDKSCHKLKRYSPDRYHRRSRDYHDEPYQRLEHDKRRMEVSPSNERHNHRRSREPHRNVYERSHPADYERLKHQSQEKYPVKHKIQQSYDESDSKRMKLDPYYRHDKEQRLQIERDFLEKKFVSEPLDIQFSSCESPDYNHPDVLPSHQIREIKLTASAKLDDPRISSRKYVVQKSDGKTALSTVDGRNVDIVLVNKTAWGIEPVTIPEALVKKPSLDSDEVVNEVYMDIENPVTNISMESGELRDLGLDSQNFPEEIVQVNEVRLNDDKEITIINKDESKYNEKSMYKLTSYKIPKLKNTVGDKQSHGNTQVNTSSEKHGNEHTSRAKNKNCQNSIKNIDQSKLLHKVDKIPDSILIDRNSEFYDSKNSYDKLAIPKEVIEGDLELSDDTCDNTETQKCVSKDNVPEQSLDSCKLDMVKHITDIPKHIIEIDKNYQSGEIKGEIPTSETSKSKPDDTKKNKNKKKPKHKAVKDSCESQKLPQVIGKTTKRKEKETKTKQIKTKFSELFGDSSSLISPEDLGLIAVPSPQLPFPEDAVDAVDLNVIKSNNTTPVEKPHDEENKQISDVGNQSSISIVSSSRESVAKNNIAQPNVTEKPIEIIYKNLEPGVLEKENDVVKTVIISTGVQPQISMEDDNKEILRNIEPQIKKVCHGVALQALATSTPHKTNVVQVEPEAKLRDVNCCSKDSRIASANNTQISDNSDNTFDSQTTATDAPDVRIFVRRRRKVVKK